MLIFAWQCIMSMVFGIANIICLGRTRKPFPAVVNVIVLGFFTYSVFACVGEVLYETAPTRCRELDPPDTLPDDPEELFARATGLREQCEEWALKMHIVREMTVYATVFYGSVLACASEFLITTTYPALRVVYSTWCWTSKVP